MVTANGRHLQAAVITCSHRVYGLTCEDYDAMYDRAGGRCELCRILETETAHGVLFIDHDAMASRTAVRGLVCNRCNGLLSWPDHWDDDFADRATDYLANAWHLGLNGGMPRERPDCRPLLSALDTAVERYRRAVEEVAEAEGEVTAAMITALRAGARRGEVGRRSPFAPKLNRRIGVCDIQEAG